MPAHRRGCNSSAKGGQGLNPAFPEARTKSDVSENLDCLKAAEAGELLAGMATVVVDGILTASSSEVPRSMRRLGPAPPGGSAQETTKNRASSVSPGRLSTYVRGGAAFLRRKYGYERG
jgi:hypothetical protein